MLIQSLDAALLTMFKIGHAPFSTLDDTASFDQQMAWLRACLDAWTCTTWSSGYRVGRSGGLRWHRIPRTGFRAVGGWKELFFVSPGSVAWCSRFEEHATRRIARRCSPV